MAAYYSLDVSLVGQQTTDAELRAIATAMDACLTGGGWVNTSDTGQTAPGSLVRTASTNTAVGFRIYRMADSLAGTSPVYMKLEWGTGAAAAVFSAWITIGTGSNGSGTVTGIRFARTQLKTNNSSTSNVTHSVLSSDTDRVTIALFINIATTNPFFLSIERERDANGATIGDGIYVTYGTGSFAGTGSMHQAYVHMTLGTLADEGDPGIFVPKVGTGVVGLDVYIYPQYLANQFFKPYGINQFGYFNSAISTETEITFTVYGVSRTYFTLGNLFVTAAGVAARGGPAGLTLMIRKT